MPLFRRIPKRGFSHATWDKTFPRRQRRRSRRGFDDGDTVDAGRSEKGRLAKGPPTACASWATGELTKKLTVKAHHFSKSAAEKIKAKGGTAEVIPPPKKPVRNKMKPRRKSRETSGAS